MNTNIKVDVADKVASVIGAPAIICGNSDYTITFSFDREWETFDIKTARFVYKRGGALEYLDVVFSGYIVAVPILTNIDEVYVGVYSGELHTTTPARIICKKSILCSDSTRHEDPGPDVYQQLMDTINGLETLPTVTGADAGKALMVNEDGHWVVRLPDFMHDQNSGDLIKFFFGTQEEWDAWTGDKNNVLFVSCDDETYADKAGHAIKADNATKVNDLEIKADANGVLKIGDVIIPQKRLLWSGSKWFESAEEQEIMPAGSITKTTIIEVVIEDFSQNNRNWYKLCVWVSGMNISQTYDGRTIRVHPDGSLWVYTSDAHVIAVYEVIE